MARQRTTRPTTNRFTMPPFFGGSDPIANSNLQKLVDNVTTLRRDAFQNLMDPRRNLNRECGFPDRVTDPRVYQDLFDWDAIASRVIECLPKETWQVQPNVYEDEDNENVTAFEQAWDGIGTSLRGNSYYQEEEGNPVWEYLLRADILSGIGQYGAILLGLDDGELDLSKPVKGMVEQNSAPTQKVSTGEGTDKQDTFKVVEKPNPNVNGGMYSLTTNAEQTKGRKLKYLRVFPEALAQITQFESNITSPRFGQPVMYLLTFNDPSQQSTGIGMPLASVNVHWTRVIHIADNLTSSEVFGSPRLRAVLRNVLSLQKVYGGSAEGYWRSCFPAVVFQTHPQLGGDVNVDQDAMKAMMENFWNQLDRSITAMGMDVKTLPPQLVDPTPTIDVHIQAICIKLGIPERVFKGSERGELASSQDDAAWNDRLKLRQQMYVTPRIVIPFIDRLIAVGVLPAPTVRKKKFDGGDSLKMQAPAAPPGGPKPGGKPGIPNKDSADPKPPAPGAPPKQPQFNAFGVPDEEQTQQTDGQPAPAEAPPNELVDAPDETSDEVDGQGDIGDVGDTGATPQQPAQEISCEPPGYCVEWPDITSQTQAEKADVANKKITALAAAITGNVTQLYPPMDLLTRLMGETEEDAEAILRNAEEVNLQKEQEDMQKQQDLIDKGLIADPVAEQDAKLEAIKKGLPPGGAPVPGQPPFGKPAVPGAAGAGKIEPPIKSPLEDKP